MIQVHVALAYRPDLQPDLLHLAGERLMQTLLEFEGRFGDMTDSTVGTDLDDRRLDVEMLLMADSTGHAHMKAVAAVSQAAAASGFTAGPPVSVTLDIPAESPEDVPA